MRLSFLLISALLLGSTLSGQLLDSPESIVYDVPRDRYIVSNAADSRLVIEEASGAQYYLSEGTAGSHGLAIIGDKLFSCHKNSILIHDLLTDRLVARYEVPSAVFLNGLCSDGESRLFATDFSKRMVYAIDFDGRNGLSHRILTTVDQIPNGITYDAAQDRLLIVTWGRNGRIMSYGLDTDDLRTLKNTAYDNLESVILDTDGSMYITGWVPSSLLRYDENSDRLEELTVSDMDRPTGITFGRNGELVMLGSMMTEPKRTGMWATTDGVDLSVRVFPNPIVTNSLITYEVQEAGTVSVDLYDTQGRLIKHLNTTKAVVGHQQLLFDRRDVPAGMYFLNIRGPQGDEATPVTLVD